MHYRHSAYMLARHCAAQVGVTDKGSDPLPNLRWCAT